MCIDKWKQAVLFKESYRYIDLDHINDIPSSNPVLRRPGKWKKILIVLVHCGIVHSLSWCFSFFNLRKSIRDEQKKLFRKINRKNNLNYFWRFQKSFEKDFNFYSEVFRKKVLEKMIFFWCFQKKVSEHLLFFSCSFGEKVFDFFACVSHVCFFVHLLLFKTNPLVSYFHTFYIITLYKTNRPCVKKVSA